MTEENTFVIRRFVFTNGKGDQKIFGTLPDTARTPDQHGMLYKYTMGIADKHGICVCCGKGKQGITERMVTSYDKAIEYVGNDAIVGINHTSLGLFVDDGKKCLVQRG